jgi:hypothetical protein
MKSTTFIHNDDVKCFHVVVQGTHKLVVMGCINFKAHALTKRRWENLKNECDGRDVQGQKKKGVTVESSLRLLLEVVHIFKVLEFTII